MTMYLLVGLLALAVAVACTDGMAARSESVVRIDTPSPPPAWALLERELLRANAAACREFFERYFDDRGYLLCVERWGGDDGPDDAAENVTDWTLLHALGASDDVLALYRKSWEGHLRQYTLAKTVDVPFARDGMYYKEFPVMFDWLHNGEGLLAFNLQGLSDPDDPRFRARVRRYAGFYLNEDPGAPNYDAKHRIIRSMFNGSRGPLLRKATGLDWAGDPIEVENRFRPLHGETSYAQMLEHFKDYNDIIGDHPQNLLSTTLAVNAFMLSPDGKYRDWVLEYAGAWRDRMAANGGIIPTNVGLDGKIGSAAGGKWYGGVYGWGFSVMDPATKRLAHRNLHHFGLVGLMNAYLLTGDDGFLEPWRIQTDRVNAQAKTIDGRTMYPRMFGDKGWYEYGPEKYSHGAVNIYALSMKPSDRKRCAANPWLDYLNGKAPGYPEAALRADLERVRSRVAEMREDASTPDTRLSDDTMRFNPASVTSLVQLTLGGPHPCLIGGLLHTSLRYFDPIRRRAGLPEDVAALVDKLSGDEAAVTLVNVNQLNPRDVIVQAGAYAEHRITSAEYGGKSIPVEGPHVAVRLAPGAGGRLTLRMKRHATPPRLGFPWGRG